MTFVIGLIILHASIKPGGIIMEGLLLGLLVVGCIIGIVGVITSCILKFQRAENEHLLQMEREKADREE